jgi:hypothetical protein
VQFEELLKVYLEVDPGASVQAGLVIDECFLKPEWKEERAFKGSVMIGGNGAEECVLRMVCSWHPRAIPPPSLATLITPLSAILDSSQIEGIFKAYGIAEKTGEEEALIANLLKVAADVIFCKPADDNVSLWAERGNEVQQYIFEQAQPFTGPFRGMATHALDLAYLHGSPEIFERTDDPEKEMGVQRAVQDSWIGFADGEVGWGGKKGVVWRFGPNEVVDGEREVVLGRWRRGREWKVLDGLRGEQESGLIGSVISFVGGVIGFESA